MREKSIISSVSIIGEGEGTNVGDVELTATTTSRRAASIALASETALHAAAEASARWRATCRL